MESLSPRKILTSIIWCYQRTINVKENELERLRREVVTTWARQFQNWRLQPKKRWTTFVNNDMSCRETYMIYARLDESNKKAVLWQLQVMGKVNKREFSAENGPTPFSPYERNTNLYKDCFCCCKIELLL